MAPPTQAAVSPASSSNPGVPPSSLMSFLRVKPSVQGAVLAEFDRAYSNPYQGSRFDDAARAGADAGAGGIAVAASVVAAAAHSLAGGAPGAFKVGPWPCGSRRDHLPRRIRLCT